MSSSHGSGFRSEQVIFLFLLFCCQTSGEYFAFIYLFFSLEEICAACGNLKGKHEKKKKKTVVELNDQKR